MKLPRLRLRSILILIYLVILLLPLGGIAALRLYESALIRQTESELIAQGAAIAAAYQTLFASGSPDTANYGQPLTAAVPWLRPNELWRPRPPTLDLATDTIHPPPPDSQAAPVPADARALTAGAALTPMLRQTQFVTLAGIRVVDAGGVIVASTAEDRGRSLAHQPEIERALSGEYVSLMRQRILKSAPPPLDSISRGTRIRVYVALPVIEGTRVIGAVLLVRTPANIRQAIYGKREPLLKGAFLLLAIVLILALFTSLTISRPVYALIDQARRAVRGEKNAVAELAHPGTREIAELSASVALMAQTLEQRAAYIRDFAAHVSHEFKTPLTAIRGAVELLRDHADGMSQVERSRFLDMLSADAGRLERLVRRLLELARADTMQPGFEICDAAAVAAAMWQRYRERGMQIQLAKPQDSVFVKMDAETLDSILANLLDNARQHAGPDARVELRVEASPGDDTARIVVADDGGIPAGNLPRLFEPFFTTAREAGNTGLGLSIIRALLHAHGGSIRLLPESRGTRGAHFEIRLPLAKASV